MEVITDKSLIITFAIPIFFLLIIVEYFYGLYVGKNTYRLNDTFTLFATFQIVSAGNHVPIIQPGAPGEPSKVLDANAATDIANTSFIKADVSFLQGMIVHHDQAIVMSKMAKERTNNKTILW